MGLFGEKSSNQLLFINYTTFLLSPWGLLELKTDSELRFRLNSAIRFGQFCVNNSLICHEGLDHADPFELCPAPGFLVFTSGGYFTSRSSLCDSSIQIISFRVRDD